MALDEKAVANALAIVTAIGYVICALLLWASPNFVTSLFNYLAHGVDISSIIVVRSFSYSLISLILGTALAWITGYLFVLIYNRLVK